MAESNVLQLPSSALPPLPMPVHFRTKALRQAWADLTGAARAEQLVPENRFTIEIAAMLLAKMRSGKAMSATESKDLKRYMIALGLAKADDAPQRKPNKLRSYRR